MSELEHRSDDHLCDADREALDRIIGSGFDPSTTTNAHADDRSARMASLLALLGTPVAGESERPTRVDLAVVKAKLNDHVPGLSPDDEAAVDAWVDAGNGAAFGSDIRADRIETMAMLGSTGEPYDKDSRDNLISRTMAKVEAEQRLHEERMKFEQGPELRGWRMRLADVVSIAAMLLLCASVAIPVLSGARERQQRLACLDNMRSSAVAFGTYAGDHADVLPMATAGFGGGSWMDVGTRDRSNSANLYTVVRTGYETLEDLACAGNPHAARGEPKPGSWDWDSMDDISYSYRIMGNGGLRISAPMLATTSVVVATDRSPVTLRASRGQVVFPEANSPNHDGQGQYVLRLDGSSSWERSSVVNGDNLWLPMPLERAIHQLRTDLGLIQGTEMPESETDAFVGP